MDQKSVKDILRCHEVPMNYEACRNLWRKVMLAFKRDPSVEILIPDLYDEILEFRKTNYKSAAAFNFRHDITNESDGYSIEIARDTDGGVLKYMKDKTGVGFLYTTNDPKIFVRFGYTKVINGCKHPFYQSCGVNVVYYDSDNYDGHAQAIRTPDGTKYYDENGTSNLKTNFWGILDDLVSHLES